MCGIAGYYSWGSETFGPLGQAEKVLQELQFRGRDATGVAWWGPAEGVGCYKAPVPAGLFKVPQEVQDAKVVLFHTRAATQGSAKDPENNHPVYEHGWFVTHNGMISNDHRLVPDFTRDRVDTRAINHVLNGATTFSEMTEGLKKLSGSIALAAMPMDRPDHVLLARLASSPLVVHMDPKRKVLVWGSTEDAVLPLVHASEEFFGHPLVTLVWVKENNAFLLTPNGVFEHNGNVVVEAPSWDDMFEGYLGYPPVHTPVLVRPNQGLKPAKNVAWRGSSLTGRPLPDWGFLPSDTDRHADAWSLVRDGHSNVEEVHTPLAHIKIFAVSPHEVQVNVYPHRRIQRWVSGYEHDHWWDDAVGFNNAHDLGVWEAVTWSGGTGVMCPHCGGIFTEAVVNAQCGECLFCEITSIPLTLDEPEVLDGAL